MTATLVPAVAGDVGRIAGGPREVVRPACGTATRGRVCLSCGVRLANECQLEFHLEQPGAHFIARDCQLHGPEALEA